jgi:hypothetical protein
MGGDKFGVQGFTSRSIADVTEVSLLFLDQRMWSIKFVYPEIVIGSWDKVVATTTDKYGTPKTNGYSEASWQDAKTVLAISKNYRGGIEVMLVDIDLRDKYNARSGQVAPKF